MSLSDKALSGFIYSFAGNVINKAINLFGSIYLARLLDPSDYGLVAMLYVIFSISNFLVNGGFAQAIIREKEIDEQDLSTVFFFNFIFAILLYALLWFLSPKIAAFYEQPQLNTLTKIMGLSLIFNSLTIVQLSMLRRNLEFKQIGIVNVSATSILMITVIILAYSGFGVIALAVKFSLGGLITSIFLYSLRPWYPKYFIKKKSFKKLFNFGANVMLLGIVNSISKQFHSIIIGKYYNAKDLGFFNQGQMLKDNVITMFHQSIISVTYPILSKIQDDTERLRRGYIKIMQIFSFVLYPIITILILSAEPLILLLLGEKWSGSIIYLQILGLTGYVGHLHSINLDVLKVYGKGKDYLLQGIIRNGLTIGAILIALPYSPLAIACALVLADFLQVFVNVYYSNKYIKFNLIHQLKAMVPSILLASSLAILLLLFRYISIENYFLLLLINVCIGILFYIGLALLFKVKTLKDIFLIIKTKLNKKS